MGPGTDGGFDVSLSIVTDPDELSRVSSPVLEVTPELMDLAREMLVLMRANYGIGLAAPQVGQRVRMFVMNLTENLDPAEDFVAFNPRVLYSEGLDQQPEGCLSLPGVVVDVVRPERIKFRARVVSGEAIRSERWRDDSPEPTEIGCDGLYARCVQHEIDHLDGITIQKRGLS